MTEKKTDESKNGHDVEFLINRVVFLEEKLSDITQAMTVMVKTQNTQTDFMKEMMEKVIE